MQTTIKSQLKQINSNEKKMGRITNTIMFHQHRFTSISLSFFRLNSFNIFACECGKSRQTKRNDKVSSHMGKRRTANADDLLTNKKPHICIYSIWSMYLHDSIQKKLCLRSIHIFCGGCNTKNQNHHTINNCALFLYVINA